MPAQVEEFYFKLNNGPNTILEIVKTQYRSAKITIQASSNTEHQLSDVYLMHDNKLGYIRQIDYIYTIDPFVTFTASVDANNLYLNANSSLVNTDLVIYGSLFDNPTTAADQTIDLESIVDTAATMASLYPNDGTDYAASMTSSLDKQNDIYVMYRKIEDGMAYMQSTEFSGQSAEFRAKYIQDLANSINNISATLDAAVDSDLQNYYDATKKIESMTAVSGLSSGYSDPNTKKLLDRVLKPEAVSIFAAKE